MLALERFLTMNPLAKARPLLKSLLTAAFGRFYKVADDATWLI